MKKNTFILEKKFLLDQKLSSDKNKKKNIPFQHFSSILIYILLSINLFYIIKLFNYLKNRDMKFLKIGDIPNRNNFNNTYNERKEEDNISKKIDSNNESIQFNNISFESIDLNNLKLIENKIKYYAELKQGEKKFINGLIRTIKPKKIVEIGVSKGGSSALILNAIKDIKDAKLFSIDKSVYCYNKKNKKTGYLIQEKFPELMEKWTLYTGGITSEFIETIGDGIDLAYIDTAHYTPGEMLDWLMVLPFLKNEALVILHDVFILYHGGKVAKKKLITSNNQLLCYIRGELILPHYGESIFFRNIGALKLAVEQKKYYYQYFLALGIQWEYMPSSKDLKLMRNFFMKYYGKKYVEIYDDAVAKNKIYLNNIKK